MTKRFVIRCVIACLVLWLATSATAAPYPCIKARPWTCFGSIELTLIGDGGSATIGMRVFGNGDIMYESKDKQSAVRKALALGPPPMRVLFTGVPDKEIQEGYPFIFFDYGFAAPIQALERAYPSGLLSVPEKETESRVRLEGEIEATLFATRLSNEKIHFRLAMPNLPVQDGFVDYARPAALADSFELDAWKDRSLRTHRTVGEARATARVP